MINKIIETLERNFSPSTKKKIPYKDLLIMYSDLGMLLTSIERHRDTVGKVVVTKYIPLLDLVVKLDNNRQRLPKYEQLLKQAYKLAARVSLKHYFIYREWDDRDKFYAPRAEILEGYIFYLQQLEENPNFLTLIANLPSGYGKLIADTEPVLTKSGWKQHGDLVAGDYVIAPNGEFALVTNTKPKHYANREVVFEDGERIKCHNEHEWVVYDRHKQKTVTVETEYLKDNLYEADGRNRFLLNQNEVLKGEHKDLPLDPYSYGVWLGDGTNKTPRITIADGDKEILNHIPYKITSRGVMQTGTGYYLFERKFRTALQSMNMCFSKQTKPKYIHEDYLTASRKQRLELLAGLIDSDGHLDRIKQRYIITTTSEEIRDGVVSLVSTFGVRTSVTKVEPTLSTSGIQGKLPVYQIGFTPDFEVPTKLERKKQTEKRVQRRIGIKEINEIPHEQGNCITVDGGVYLVGKTLKPTHNSFTKKVSEAWSFGRDATGTFLSLCSNDDVVKGGSRTVREEMKSEAFGEVFPELLFDEKDRTYFTKETDGMWALRDARLQSSYLAYTTRTNVVGHRASKGIHIDDLYANHNEALNSNLNKNYYNDYVTVWRKRYVQHLEPKVCLTGTLWASGDFISLTITDLEDKKEMVEHPYFKYTRVSKDGTSAIVQVPALDYETGLSTAPSLRSTEKLLEEKQSIDEYLWETNFQQRPTDPDELMFSYNKLRTFDTLPNDLTKHSYAVIDATRRSGRDYFSMPIFAKRETDNNYEYYMRDVIFTKVATADMYEAIVQKIIENNIVELVIESNVAEELKSNLDRILKRMGVTHCDIRNKYNTEHKQTRIEMHRSTVLRQLVFPKKENYGLLTDTSEFMNNLNNYNHNGGATQNDDAPDSCALFCAEIIEEKNKPQPIEILTSIRRFI